MNEIFFNMERDEAVLCLFENRTDNVQSEIRFLCKDESIEIVSSRILQLEQGNQKKGVAALDSNGKVYYVEYYFSEEDSGDLSRAEKCTALLQDFLRKEKGYTDESMPHMLVIMVTHLPIKELGVYRARVSKIGENRDERYDRLFVITGAVDDL